MAKDDYAFDEPGTNVARIVTAKTDVEIAAEIRAEMRQHLDDICGALNRAKEKGFIASFQLQPDGMGRQFIANLVIAKHF